MFYVKYTFCIIFSMEKKKRVTYNIAYIGVVEIKYKTVKLNIVDLNGHQELDSMLVFSHCLGT